jgi:hypothetical protein
MLKIESFLPDTTIFWQGVEHKAIPEIFNAETRLKYLEIVSKFDSFTKNMRKAKQEYASAVDSGKDKDVLDKIEKKQEKIFREQSEAFQMFGALMEHLYPSIKALGWFEENSNSMPAQGISIITKYVRSLIMGMPFDDSERRYTHDTAERIMNILADKEAIKLGCSREEVLQQVEKTFEKK